MSEKVKIAVTPPFMVGGSLFTAKQLEKIGSLIDEQSQIELTTFKQLYVEVDKEKVEEVKSKLEEVGLNVYPAGFYTKGLIACNFCKGAEEAGLEFAKELNRAIAGIETPQPLKIGYAGCALGTSEPRLKDISVVKMLNTYDIYVGGEAKGIKAKLADLFISMVPEDQVITIVVKMIEQYKKDAKGKEKYAKYINRIGMDTLKKQVYEEAI